MNRLDVWALCYKTAIKVSGKSDIEFIYSKDYDRLKQRINKFCKKHNIKEKEGVEK